MQELAPSTHTSTSLPPLPLPDPSPSLYSLHIKPPLQKHPDQTPRAHNHGPRKRLPPPRRPKNKPLAPKMRKRNHIRPDSELVERGVIDIVRSVEANHRRQERPGAERTAREPGYVRGLLDGRVGGGGVVHARGVG